MTAKPSAAPYVPSSTYDETQVALWGDHPPRLSGVGRSIAVSSYALALRALPARSLCEPDQQRTVAAGAGGLDREGRRVPRALAQHRSGPGVNEQRLNHVPVSPVCGCR